MNAPAEEFPVTEEMLDEASQDSFPASDPPAYSIPVGTPVDTDPSRLPAGADPSAFKVRPVGERRDGIDDGP